MEDVDRRGPYEFVRFKYILNSNRIFNILIFFNKVE